MAHHLQPVSLFIGLNGINNFIRFIFRLKSTLIIMNHVIIQDSHVDPSAIVLYREIFAKNTVPVSLTNVAIVP